MSKSSSGGIRKFHKQPLLKEVLDAAPTQYHEHIKSLFQLDDDLGPLASEMFPSDAWAEFNDEEVVNIINEKPGQQGSTDDTISQMARRMLQELFPDPSSHDVVAGRELLLRLVIQTSLIMEFDKRRRARENPNGRTTMDFLVYMDPESRTRIMDAATKGLDWHPEYRDQEDAKDEIISMASTALTRRLKPLLDAKDPLKERMLASLDGRLNRIPDNVRNTVKDKLESLYERLKQLPSGKESSEDYTETEHERIPDSRALQDSKVLIEEMLKHPRLNSKERVLVEMLRDGHTQAEIADLLGITQPAISQKIDAIRRKLSRPPKKPGR